MKLLPPGYHFLQGNVVIAEAALIAGCRFFAGYPITPSSEIMEHMAKRLPEVGGVFIQAEDEIAAINIALGASAAGLKSMTATSGPGLSLMEEGIGLGFMLELPLVIVDVQRVGPSTGIPTLGAQGDVMQCIWGSHGDRETVVFVPATMQELFDLTIRAFNVAEELRLPVFLLTEELLAHAYGKVRVPDYSEIKIVERRRATDPKSYKPFEAEDLVPLFAEPGKGFRFHMESLVHDERGYPIIDRDATDKLLRRLLAKVRANRDRLVDYEIYGCNSGRIDLIVVTFGALTGIVKEVISRIGRGIVLFRPRTLWPFPDRELAKLIDETRPRRIAVVEMNYGQVVHIVREAVALSSEKPDVIHIAVTPGFYPSPSQIVESLRDVMG